MCEYYVELYRETTTKNDLMPLIKQANVEVELWKTGITFTGEKNALNPVSGEWQVNDIKLLVIRGKLNNKKSCGSDGLSNFILKRCPKIFWEITRVIMNNCIANSYFTKDHERSQTKGIQANQYVIQLGEITGGGNPNEN